MGLCDSDATRTTLYEICKELASLYCVKRVLITLCLPQAVELEREERGRVWGCGGVG